MQSGLFDIQSIRDDGWKRRYEALQKRYDDQARFIERDYGFGDRRISVAFEEIDHANAYVVPASNGYEIRIASTFPYLLKAMFSRILADPDVMPWVSMDGVESLVDFEIFYSINANRIGEQITEQHYTSVERERIALLLSDIAMEFVFLHEVAHILCGHADAKRKLTPDDPRLIELSLTRRGRPETVSRSRAWECEADLIGANLLKTYVDTLIQHACSGTLGNTRTRLFGVKEIHVEQCISLSLMAIYVLFRFLRETSNTLDLVGFYPDPLVRAYAVRGALYQSMSKKHSIDQELLEDLLGARLEEARSTLDKMNVRTGMKLEDEGPERLDAALEALFATRDKHAPLLKEYRFFEWG